MIPDQLKYLKEEIDETYRDLKLKVDAMVESQRPDIETSLKALGTSLNEESGSKVRFRWDEDLRALVWNALCIEWEMAQLDNELQYVFLVLTKQSVQQGQAAV